MKSGVPSAVYYFFGKHIRIPFIIYIYRGVPVYNIIVKVLRKYSRTTLIFDQEFNVQILSFERVRIVKLLLFREKHEIREEEKPRRIRSRYVKVFGLYEFKLKIYSRNL